MAYTVTAEQFERIEELYNDGLSDAAIEKTIGVSDSVVGRWRKARGLESNYMKRIGMPAPYTRLNFEGCYNYNDHTQRFFAEVGADTEAEKRWALMCLLYHADGVEKEPLWKRLVK